MEEPSETEHLAQTLHKAHALKAVLESEFDALKQQDLEAFEGLQTAKARNPDFLSQ